MVRYSRAAGCRRAQLLPYFEAVSEEIACGTCDNCLAEAAGRTDEEDIDLRRFGHSDDLSRWHSRLDDDFSVAPRLRFWRDRREQLGLNLRRRRACGTRSGIARRE